MGDQGQKTEQATPRRLEKARREGQFAPAREFVSALHFLVFVAFLSAWGGRWFAGFRETARRLLAQASAGELGPDELHGMALAVASRDLLPLLAAGGALTLVSVAVRLTTTRFGLSLQQAAPDLKRLNPAGRLRQLPSQNLAALGQALLMLPLACAAIYGAASGQVEQYLRLPMASLESGARQVSESILDLLWKAGGLFLVFGLVDLARQQQRHRRELRMTKQEVRDEAKEMEGNPQVKAQIRRLRRGLLRRQMMKEVPTATAVVVNPTHYAVALRYRMDSMAAPVVVAKGRNWLALRIRQVATEHQIPIVENPPLAQALYKYAEPGQEIPPHLYRAVAEVLAYIFRLMNRRS